MSNINKNSVASVITDFASNLKQGVINPNEAFATSPASFVGSLSSSLAKIAAYTYYNSLMAKNEIQPSTAILMKSLLRHLKSDDLSGIYATPAEMGFILSYPEEELVKAAVPTSDGKLKLTLNKGTVFYVGDKPTFTLDYNVDIVISKYTLNGKTNTSIYAKYNTDDKEAGDVVSVSNAFITTRNDVVKDNVKYFSMYLNVKQYARDYKTFNLSGESTNFTVEYDNNLIGFVVLYKPQSSFEYRQLPVFLEGEQQTTGMSYSLTENSGAKKITLRFSKIPSAFNPTNGQLKVVTYTTSGKDGNFKFDSTDDESVNNADLNVSFAQDLSDPYQEALVSIVPSGTLTDCKATGGSNAKTIEEIRNLVTQDISSNLISPSQIESVAERHGLTAFKFRYDLHSMEYILYSFLADKDSYVIPTKMITMSYLYDEIALNPETGSRTIKPSDIFKFDEKDKVFRYVKYEDQESYSDFYSKYLLNKTDQMAFPYFIRIQNGYSLSTTVYDESIDFVGSTKMEFLSPTILDKASIVSASVFRNPLNTNLRALNDAESTLKDYYMISFTVNTSESIISHLKNLPSDELPYMKIRVIVKNTADGTKYVANVNLDDCTFDEENKIIICRAFLKTNSTLTSNGKIGITDNSIVKLPYSSAPYSFYYIDGKINLELAIIFKNTEDERIMNSYNSYLTEVEQIDNYYVGVLYSVDNINLVTDMSDKINIIPDVKLTQPTYKVADKDIADTYATDEYKMVDGVYAIEKGIKELPDGTTSTIDKYVKLHSAGDIKKEYNGRVGTFNVLGNANWTWSNEDGDTTGIYNDGSILGQESVFAMVQWNGLVIFGGEDGRIGCFDSKAPEQFGAWYPYNSTQIYRTGANYNTSFVIRNVGTAMNNANVRGMIVVKNKSDKDILVVFGDKGYVASCDLSSNTWRKYNGDSGNSIATIYNNGNAMGGEPIYAAESYLASNGDRIIVFAGGSGRVCSFNVDTNTWYAYNTTNIFSSMEHPYSDGSVRNYKSIFTVSKYLESILYMSGIEGRISTLDITSGTFANMNDGSVIGKVSVYASCVTNGVYVIAGKDGYIASYNIAKNTWSTYNQGAGLADNGLNMGGDICAVIGYDVNVLFAGIDGRVSSYDLTTLEWTRYDSTTGLCNDGSFIKNTVSAVVFDSTESNVIFFAGKTGNIVYKYHTGDVMLDANGKPIVDVESQQIGYLKMIPAYSRIYAVKNKFSDVINSYSNLMDKIDTLSGDFPDGCLLFAGVKTTSGASGTFKFKNLEKDEDEFLDSLAISLKIGVKFDDSITDINKTYLVSTIKSKIIEYISDIQSVTTTNRIEISIDEMLKSVKDDVPNIRYFEYYGLNNYTPQQLQTIYCDKGTTSVNSEYLSIKNEIDEANSNISNLDVSFNPAISVAIL